MSLLKPWNALNGLYPWSLAQAWPTRVYGPICHITISRFRHSKQFNNLICGILLCIAECYYVWKFNDDCINIWGNTGNLLFTENVENRHLDSYKIRVIWHSGRYLSLTPLCQILWLVPKALWNYGQKLNQPPSNKPFWS